jgi:hypothetical protein
VKTVAAHSRNADRSSRGRLLIVLVRLLWGVGWTETSEDPHDDTGVEEGLSSIQAIPAGAWEESTWSTRSAASMNDVDADEYWQIMAAEEGALAGLGPRFCSSSVSRSRPLPG